jgi:hypothetical protein
MRDSDQWRNSIHITTCHRSDGQLKNQASSKKPYHTQENGHVERNKNILEAIITKNVT